MKSTSISNSFESNNSDLDKAKDAAYRFLTPRVRSEFEVRRKLKEKGFNDDTTALAVERLKELKLLDDRDFAIRMTKDLINLKGCGRYYIQRKLKEKGINPETIETAIESVFAEINELEVAERLALRKIKVTIDDPKEKARIGRFLQGRGFSWDIIKEVFKGLDDRKRDQE
ncbi:MAG: regulatory protein RecX [bacterium]|nr:regulatory protein RecX [bacterium]